MKVFIAQLNSMFIDLVAQGEQVTDARKKQLILDALTRTTHYRSVASTLSLSDSAHAIAVDDMIATLISEEKKRISIFNQTKPNKSFFADASSSSSSSQPQQQQQP